MGRDESEELPGGRGWPYPGVLQPVGMLGLRGAPQPAGDAGTERKTWNLLSRATEKPSPGSRS